MKFTCDRCDAQYMISDEKVGPNGVKVRCKKCSNVILVRRSAENGAVANEAPAPAPVAPTGGEGLDAELGNAFDHAFGETPAKGSPAPAPRPDAAAADLDSTQAVSPEEAARLAALSAPPEPAATEWYVAIGQAQVGPLPLVEVRRKWETGDVGPESLVWRPGMGDWSALTGVKDLSAYLTAVPRGAPRPKVEVSSNTIGRATAAGMAAATPAPAAGGSGAVSWKPVGASALAALASEELAGQAGAGARPEAKPAPAAGLKSLVDALPDGGGVDPTGALPLSIKALEQRTGEQNLPRRSGVARSAEQIRNQRTSRTWVIAVAAAVVLCALAAGAYLLLPRLLSPAPGPVAETPAPRPPAAEVAAAPPAKPAEPPPAQPAPATAETSPPPATATPAVAEAPPPPAQPLAAATPKEPPAEAAPEPKAPPARAAKEPKAAREKPSRHAEARVAKDTKVARAEPGPAAEPAKPARKKGGDVLDFDNENDAALNDALGAGGGKTGRSVYVPPAAGAGVPASVTDSQVQEAIMTRVSALQQCLGDQKARDASASGVLKMRWTIAPDGGAQDVKCVTPEFASTPFTQCMSNVLKSVRYPKSQQGRQDVTFPFKF
jgi:predicted Zn finger-like uncharacterized protein